MNSQNSTDEATLPLQRFAVENYGCLKKTEIEFSPFTVLVGPNDSGKTMILKALESLSLSRERVSNAFRTDEIFQSITSDYNGLPISFRVSGNAQGTDFSYAQSVASTTKILHIASESLKLGNEQDSNTEYLQVDRDETRISTRYRIGGTIKSEGTSPVLNESDVPILSDGWLQSRFKPGGVLAGRREIVPCAEAIIACLEHFVPFRLNTEQLRRPVSVGNSFRPGPFDRDGFGIAKYLADILLRFDHLIPKIDKVMRDAMTHVRKIRAKLQDGSYVLDLETPTGAHVDHSLISDGVVLFLAYVLLANGPEPRPILIVEEPEIGIHPGLLEHVISFLRCMTTGEYGGSRVQVILTTHSPILLNFVEPHEIRVVQRTESDGTKVYPFQNAPDIERLLEYQGPGEIWVNMKEDYITSGASAP